VTSRHDSSTCWRYAGGGLVRCAPIPLSLSRRRLALLACPRGYPSLFGLAWILHLRHDGRLAPEMSKKRHLLQSSVVVGFFSLLGSLTGILVDTAIAAKLGLSKSSDAFYVAFTVPYIIVNLLSATGQFSLVPFFSALDARHSEEEQWRGFSYVINLVFLGSSAVAVVGAAAAPWVIRGIAPGLTAPQVGLASQLCPWLFLIIVPAGLSETFRCFLLSQHRFALPSAAGFLRNVAVVGCIVFTFDRYGIYSIVLGYFVGYLLQLAALSTHTLAAFRVRYSLTLAGHGEAFRNLRGSGTAQLVGALAWQGVVIVERIIASFLPPGSLTALNYGLKIVSTLAELVSGSVGTAALPGLSRAFVRSDRAEERRTFRHALQIGFVLISPLTVFCLLLPRPIMRLVFERGNFTPEATSLMSTIFFYYCLSLVLFAGIRALAFYLFARQEGGQFIRVSLLQYGLTIAFDLFYVGVLQIGPKGIPLGFVSALIVTCALVYRRNVAEIRMALDRSLATFTLKALAGSALAALAVALLRAMLRSPQTGVQNVIYLCELCGAGSLVFMGSLAALGAVQISQLAALWYPAEHV
jgi:putative peptidoglycan lipid II flippase